MNRLLTKTFDTVLDRTVVPGYPKIGYGLRRMTWEKDDPLLTVPAPLRIGCCLAPKTVPAGW